jgi:hypothetical protein
MYPGMEISTWESGARSRQESHPRTKNSHTEDNERIAGGAHLPRREEEEEEEGREGRCVGVRPPLVPGDKGAALPECPTRKRTSNCSLFLLSYSLLILPFVCFLFFFFIYFLRMGNYWQSCNFLHCGRYFLRGSQIFFAQCENRISSSFRCMQCKCWKDKKVALTKLTWGRQRNGTHLFQIFLAIFKFKIPKLSRTWYKGPAWFNSKSCHAKDFTSHNFRKVFDLLQKFVKLSHLSCQIYGAQFGCQIFGITNFGRKPNRPRIVVESTWHGSTWPWLK